jgi:hypothetical protein
MSQVVLFCFDCLRPNPEGHDYCPDCGASLNQEPFSDSSEDTNKG